MLQVDIYSVNSKTKIQDDLLKWTQINRRIKMLIL